MKEAISLDPKVKNKRISYSYATLLYKELELSMHLLCRPRLLWDITLLVTLQAMKVKRTLHLFLMSSQTRES